MRLSVVPSLSTKDAVANKNARMTNVLNERGKAVIRPGLVSVLDYSGIGAGLVSFNNTLLSIFDDTVYVDNTPMGGPGGGGASGGGGGSGGSSVVSFKAAFDFSVNNWNVAATYAMGDSVWYDGGSGKHLWFSLVDNNTGNTPPSVTTEVSPYWATSFPPDWNPGYTYNTGAVVFYNGYIWHSFTDGNIGNAPAADSAFWTSPNPPAAEKASGGTITYDGSYSIHTFTASGTFTVNTAPLSVDYLIVGGGGGSWQGGGGAGGLSYVTGHSIAGTGPITVTVGAGSEFGGAGATNGGDTTFITTVSGGGRGGGEGENGAAGGCGGGGGWGAAGGGTTTGGAGSVGFAGGGGVNDVDDLVPAGGGGGGMGAVGTDAVELTSSGNGGDGVQNSISGAAVWYSGGGAGEVSGGSYGTAGQGQSGPGGGGSEKVGVDLDAQDGIVIIRYLT